jgi:hypothetical protein
MLHQKAELLCRGAATRYRLSDMLSSMFSDIRNG